ncbi:hypothetical protein A5647_04965 [Mycobacterium sp. 1100029.7]|nr:hypothetical protein A5647_04965 [Mycobacterium sp. 1100029.7]
MAVTKKRSSLADTPDTPEGEKKFTEISATSAALRAGQVAGHNPKPAQVTGHRHNHNNTEISCNAAQ